MRIAILGAGPAGLYLSYLTKRRRPDAEVIVVEQNPPDATFGFGVVFSDRALEFLREGDEETFAAIVPQMEAWNDMTIVHRNERVVIDGIGFSAIGRLTLLQLLQQRVRSVGVEPQFGKVVRSLDDFDGADLVVGADGVNSLVRQTLAREFGASVTLMNNRFAWFGTSKPFDTLTQTFRHTPIGDFNAHHYRYAPRRSTFLVETDEATFARAGFERMDEGDARSLCEKVFADALGGARLISNNSIWRRFPQVWNARWQHGKYVLIGDALHTAHFSIGSGTRLAMEDAIALDKRARRAWRRRRRSASRLRVGAPAGRGKAGHRRHGQRRLVREFRRSHGADAAGVRHELYPAFRPRRPGTLAQVIAEVRGAV